MKMNEKEYAVTGPHAIKNLRLTLILIETTPSLSRASTSV